MRKVLLVDFGPLSLDLGRAGRIEKAVATRSRGMLSVVGCRYDLKRWKFVRRHKKASTGVASRFTLCYKCSAELGNTAGFTTF